MIITPAYAQNGGGMESFITFLPIIAIFAIFYFLIIRPQQKRAKAHRAMVDNVARGDTVVTAGGLVGRVRSIEDTECLVEIAKDTQVRVVKATLADVRGKDKPPATVAGK